MRRLLYTIIAIGNLVLLTRCSRKNCDCTTAPEPHSTGSQKLGYGDSVFYLRSTDYAILPSGGKTGTYTAYPDNLTINRTTGAITVTPKGADGESQTGMWYKITYRSAANEVDSTFILLSGITYVDRFYNLAQNDSIIYPIYNGSPGKAAPAGNYDLQHDDKFAINRANGQININECTRRGFFSGQMMGWKKTTIRYSVKDKSNEVENGIDIVLYYYRSLADVPENVSKLMQAHRAMTVGFDTEAVPSTSGATDNNLPGELSLSKPRPPCVVVIGH